MATSKPDTIGSQFFITYARQNHLNNVNTVIGQCVHCSFGLFPRPHAALRPLQMARTSPFLCVCVFVSMCVLRAMWWTWHIGVTWFWLYSSVIDGMDTLDAMEAVPVVGKKHRPAKEMKLLRVTIHANPLAPAVCSVLVWACVWNSREAEQPRETPFKHADINDIKLFAGCACICVCPQRRGLWGCTCSAIA